eukprot:scaffold56111_cov27-Tisochrysis_lutea.AAC.7
MEVRTARTVPVCLVALELCKASTVEASLETGSRPVRPVTTQRRKAEALVQVDLDESTEAASLSCHLSDCLRDPLDAAGLHASKEDNGCLDRPLHPRPLRA